MYLIMNYEYLTRLEIDNQKYVDSLARGFVWSSPPPFPILSKIFKDKFTLKKCDDI